MIRARGSASGSTAAETNRLVGRVLDKVGVYLKGAWENPNWILIFTFGRLVAVRRLLRLLSGSPAAAAEPEPSLFPNAPITRIIEGLRADGIYLGIHLPEKSLNPIYRFAATNACYGAFDPGCPFLADDHEQAERKYRRSFLVGHFLDTIERCPEIQALQADPVLQRIAAGYLGPGSVPIATRLWWSFPSHGALDRDLRKAAQDRLHPDINDWRSVKFFFYLTDVDEGSGAHVFVRRTHRLRRLRHQFTLFTGHTRKALVEAYGEDSFTMVCGPAGFGFVEDPFGFHTGTIVKHRRRLILQVEFGVTPVSPDRFYGGEVSKISLRHADHVARQDGVAGLGTTADRGVT